MFATTIDGIKYIVVKTANAVKDFAFEATAAAVQFVKDVWNAVGNFLVATGVMISKVIEGAIMLGKQLVLGAIKFVVFAGVAAVETIKATAAAIKDVAVATVEGV